VHALTGLEIDEGGGTRALDAKTRRQHLQQVKKPMDEYLPPSSGTPGLLLHTKFTINERSMRSRRRPSR
jgi:hypothetical protein